MAPGAAARARLPETAFKLDAPGGAAVKIGCHVSIAGSIDRAVDNAQERGCTAFQIFTSNPRGWHARPIPEADAAEFRRKVKETGIGAGATVAHMPYLPNLASPDDERFAKSAQALAREVSRCGQLGIPYLVTHLGSHMGSGEEAGMDRLVEGLTGGAEIDNGVTILLENTAGQKNSVGSDFGQWGQLLRRLRPARRFGACLDTCHAFAAGYDMRSAEAAKAALAEFGQKVGTDRLKVLHLNDSKGELGSRLDRHEHIGMGGIGNEGMREAVRAASKAKIPVILETPIDDVRSETDDIEAARGLA